MKKTKIAKAAHLQLGERFTPVRGIEINVKALGYDAIGVDLLV